MTYWMLNLIFDANDQTSADNGRFQADNNNPNALMRSKVWLTSSDNNNWTFNQVDDGDPITLAVADQVSIRVQGLNVTSSWVARLTVLVSRDTKRALRNPNSNHRYQTRASPFPSGQLPPLNAQSCVLYDFENPTYQAMQNGAWVQPLGTVTFTTPAGNGRPASFLDAYSVIVAVTAGQNVGAPDPQNAQKYSHDPDMDVQC